MDCYIGLDMGTSAVKGVLLSREGRVLATASGQFAYFTDKGGKLMEPARFLETCFGVIRELAAYPGAKVAAICPSCASGNLILLDGDGAPLIPIIGWQSQVGNLDALLTKEEQRQVYPTVGWPAIPSFPLACLLWIRKNREDLLRKAGTVCMSAEYLNFALTGKLGISHSMGTPFYLMDQKKGIYNAPLLEKLGITEAMLPPILEKSSVLGTVKAEMCKALGLAEGTSVVLGTFDHPSGALGAGVLEPGQMLLSCGTSWVEFFPAESREKVIAAGALCDRFLLNGAPYCLMKSISSLSDRIAQYREHFFGMIPYGDFDALALAAAPGCGGLRFDFTGDDYAKADGFSEPDIARAIIESAADRLAVNLAAMEAAGFRAEQITVIGGITNSPAWVGIISQTLDRDVRVVNGVSAGAVGAAMLAAIGVGHFADEKSCFEAMRFEVKEYKRKQ